MKRLFESRKVLTSMAALPMPDAKIIFTKVPYIQYELILLNKNFRQNLGKKMVSKKKQLRMGTQKTPIQKTCINIGQDTLDIDFLGASRQFD